MRRLHAARNAISTAIRRYFSLGRVVKCADATHCDARRLEIAFFLRLVNDFLAFGRAVGLTLNLPDSRPNRRHFQEVPADSDKQLRSFLRLQECGNRQVAVSETGRPSFW